MKPASFAIDVHSLSYFYPNGARALNDVSFSVERGSIFALLGPNGSGKSTTIHILTTLLKHKIGRVAVLGFDISKEPENVRNSLGVIFQRPSLDGGLTIWENLYFYGTLKKIPKRELLNKIETVCSIFGLEDKMNVLARTLSGGLFRRVDLARVFLAEPDILFLDEPTFGIDPAMKGRFHQFLLQLCKSGDLTILFATHDLHEAETLSNKIGFLSCGKWVALASPNELKQKYGQRKIKISFSAPPIIQKFDRTDIYFESSTVWIFPNTGVGSDLHEILSYCLSIGIIANIEHSEPSLDDVFFQLLENGKC